MTISAPAIAALPTRIPFLRAETEVHTASPDYDGNYTTRYVSRRVRDLVEEELMCADDEYEAQEITNKVLQNVEWAYESFSYLLGIESEDSDFGIVRGYTTDHDGLGRFVESNIGVTLRQMMTGVQYEGGLVTIDLDYLAEEIAEQGLDGDEDWNTDRIAAIADRYVLREGSNFELLCD